MTFVLKILGLCGFGFAAGVGFAAVATPRRGGAFYIFGLCPRCGPWLNKSEGPSPDQGHNPGLIPLLSVGGASHRREANSGDKAEADMVPKFEAQLDQ